MRYTNQNKPAPLPLILMLCALLILTVLPGSAMTSRGTHRSMPMLRDRGCCTGGTVTDTDGIIGNGTSGADAPHALLKRSAGRMHTPGRMAEHAARGAEDVARGAADATRDMARDAADAVGEVADGVRDRVQNGAQRAEQGQSRTKDAARTGDVAGDAQGGSIVGWVVAVLVIVGIVLTVLALLPKRGRGRG